MPSKNPQYQKEYIRKHYQANKKYYKDKRRARQQQLRPKLRAFTDRYKIFCGCVDCGYKGHPAALQFDHVRGTKFKNVSTMVSECYTLERIKKEIRKCEVRCANCHMVVTNERRE